MIWVLTIGASLVALVAYALVGLWRDRRAEKAEQHAMQNLQLLRTPGPNHLGPLEQWPWGQKPAKYMIDPEGYVAGPIGNIDGWIAAHRGNVEQGIRTELRRVEPWEE